MLERIYGLSSRARLIESGGLHAGPLQAESPHAEPPGAETPHAESQYQLLCDYPLQRVALNASAFRLLNALDGETHLHGLVEPVAPAWVDFLESLVSQGCLTVRHRATAPGGAHGPWPRIEVVIPALGNAAGLERCLAALTALDYPRERWTVTVVDDGTEPPLERQLGPQRLRNLRAGLPALRWIRLPCNEGPASARNAALAVNVPETPEPDTSAEWVAFVDSDCVPGAGWLAELAGALEEPGLAAIGGRVLGLSRRTWLARYEDECASLNLGLAGGPVGAPGDRLPYLPACNLLVLRAALRAVGGFTPGLRVGEDVDLIWRMQARGLRAFYLPAGVVRHDYRDRIWPFLRRKAAYATSEAWLRRAHPAQFAGRPNRAPDLALASIAAGVLVGGGAWTAGLAAAGAVLLVESARHGGSHAVAFGSAEGSRPGAVGLALARRAVAQVLMRCRTLVRRHGILALPLLPVGVWRPGLLAEAGAIWLMAAGGEMLARRPKLPPWLFVAGYSLDALGYSFGRWASGIAGWMRGGRTRGGRR